MHDFRWTALLTLAAVALLMALAANVGRQRHRHGINAPATSGHPEFERAYRAQMNTIENAVAFLPVLWLYSAFLSDAWAAMLGAAWVAARAWYAIAYQHDPAQRGAPFTLSLLIVVVLALGAAWGVLSRFL